jgi:hypothetical protein
MKWMTRAIIALCAVAAPIILIGSGTATAAPTSDSMSDATAPRSVAEAEAMPIPRDVQKFFSGGAALAGVQTTFPAPSASHLTHLVETPLPDMSHATGFGSIHEMYSFSSQYLSGEKTDLVVTSTQTWIAPILGPSGLLGYAGAWKQTPTSKPEEIIDASPTLGIAINDVKNGLIVHDAPSGEWFTVAGTTVAPLNPSASCELPRSAPLSEFQATIAHRYAARKAQSAGTLDSMGGAGAPSDRQPWDIGRGFGVFLAALGLVLSASILGFMAGGIKERTIPSSAAAGEATEKARPRLWTTTLQMLILCAGTTMMLIGRPAFGPWWLQFAALGAVPLVMGYSFRRTVAKRLSQEN